MKPGLLSQANQMDQGAPAAEQPATQTPDSAAAPEQGMQSQDIKVFKEGYQLAKQFFYQEKFFDAMVQDVQKSSPADAISGAVVTVLLRIQEQTGKISLPAAAALGIALLDDVAETMEKAGVMQNSPELQEQMLVASTQMWLQANNYPPQEVAAALEGMGVPPEAMQAISQQQSAQPQAQQQALEQPQAQPAGGMA